jgi:hypothetical protein
MPAEQAYENANEHAAFKKITTMAIGEEDGGFNVVIL